LFTQSFGLFAAVVVVTIALFVNQPVIFAKQLTVSVHVPVKRM